MLCVGRPRVLLSIILKTRRRLLSLPSRPDGDILVTAGTVPLLFSHPLDDDSIEDIVAPASDDGEFSSL